MISIIVPVYKVEKYLKRCIDSILSQTYTDFELILVDDGSPDNCGAICDEYAQKDGRIIVIHKENGGLSSARNAGLDVAIGDYIGFVDSDDMIGSHYYEALLYFMNKKLSGLEGKRIRDGVLRYSIAAAAMSAGLLLWQHFVHAGTLVIVVGGLAIGIGIYFAVCALLKVEELGMLKSLIKR